MNEDCRWALDGLAAHLDGELSSADEARLVAHLAGCPACRAEDAAQRECWAAFVAAHPVEALPEALHENPFRPQRRVPVPRRLWLLAGAAACAALLLWPRPDEGRRASGDAEFTLTARPGRGASRLPVPPLPPAGQTGLSAPPRLSTGGSGLSNGPYYAPQAG